jgi:hypothetical protein
LNSPPFASGTPATPPPNGSLDTELNVGENVLLRGGGKHDSRMIWSVVKIGTNLITLRGPNGEIEIAQKADLYNPSDIVSQTPTPMPYSDINPIQEVSHPGINIAPVFNFGTMENKITPITKYETEPVTTTIIKADDIKKIQEEPIDFNKLIIKKL